VENSAYAARAGLSPRRRRLSDFSTGSFFVSSSRRSFASKRAMRARISGFIACSSPGVSFVDFAIARSSTASALRMSRATRPFIRSVVCRHPLGSSDRYQPRLGGSRCLPPPKNTSGPPPSSHGSPGVRPFHPFGWGSSNVTAGRAPWLAREAIGLRAGESSSAQGQGKREGEGGRSDADELQGALREAADLIAAGELGAGAVVEYLRSMGCRDDEMSTLGADAISWNGAVYRAVAVAHD
jgi:hypothetical protein